MQEEMKLSEMSLDELQEAQTRVLVAKAAFVDFIAEHPPIDWHETKFGPVPLKKEGRRLTEDPKEDEFRLQAFDERLALISEEVNRRLDAAEATYVERAREKGTLEDEEPFTDEELADVLVHMHQAITAKKTEGDPTPQIEKTAEVLHNSGLIDDDEHAKLVGKPAQDLDEESLVRALVDVRQMKGDGVELLSVQHPSSASDLDTDGGDK